MIGLTSSTSAFGGFSGAKPQTGFSNFTNPSSQSNFLTANNQNNAAAFNPSMQQSGQNQTGAFGKPSVFGAFTGSQGGNNPPQQPQQSGFSSFTGNNTSGFGNPSGNKNTGFNNMNQGQGFNFLNQHPQQNTQQNPPQQNPPQQNPAPKFGKKIESHDYF